MAPLVACGARATRANWEALHSPGERSNTAPLLLCAGSHLAKAVTLLELSHPEDFGLLGTSCRLSHACLPTLGRWLSPIDPVTLGFLAKFRPACTTEQLGDEFTLVADELRLSAADKAMFHVWSKHFAGSWEKPKGPQSPEGDTTPAPASRATTVRSDEPAGKAKTETLPPDHAAKQTAQQRPVATAAGPTGAPALPAKTPPPPTPKPPTPPPPPTPTPTPKPVVHGDSAFVGFANVWMRRLQCRPLCSHRALA